jgi:hypothetical protein
MVALTATSNDPEHTRMLLDLVTWQLPGATILTLANKTYIDLDVDLVWDALETASDMLDVNWENYVWYDTQR